MDTPDLSRARYRKSSRSSANGQCIEVADNIPGLVGTLPGAVFSARHAGLRSGGMGTVSDDIERCESMAEDRW